jgi:glyoxylase-like metal-dependent hydrolase (beta-lactamase superfamily II)
MPHASPPGTTLVTDLDAARGIEGAGRRLRALRVAAERMRHRFAAGPRALAVRTLPVVVSPYPTRHAFFDAARSPAPYVLLSHRCVLVQFLQAGEPKTLLFNPTDVDGARATPFYARSAKGVPSRLRSAVTREHAPLVDQLARLGLRADDVDYVAYDHLHAQDLRPVLGTDDGRLAPRFPRATLIAPAIEWDDWDDLHPLQRPWFVRDGKLGVARDRVALTRGDLLLGDGAMLLRTPGRSAGHQTLFVNTDSGVWGVGANGACADAWSPMDSRIPGLRSWCRAFDVDAVPAVSTLERAADQYASMVLERAVVDRVKRAPAFVQMFPSSEVTPSALSPGLKPTILHRELTHGMLSARRSAAAG